MTLDGALAALENDHAYLLKGDVFTGDLIEHWIAVKREQEVAALAARPHPWEFCQYFDV
jgi:glutamine synthetase